MSDDSWAPVPFGPMKENEKSWYEIDGEPDDLAYDFDEEMPLLEDLMD